jgi:hypothetical protein
MNIIEYFQSRETPQAESPVGRLMVRILEKNPGMEFETARIEAHKMLQQAAGRRKYVISPVLSPEEKILAAARLKDAFRKDAIPA